ncbi:MAG: hypothetical protein IJM71_08145 [Clostridia bacterium]|nr:hypothetical protein [Clostridia bacterium]
MKKVLALVLICFTVLSVTACGLVKKTSDEWPSSGLATKIPKPTKGIIRVIIDDSDKFTATIEKTDSDFNRNYLSECISMGYEVDVKEKGSSYKAFNNEGYMIEIYSFSNSMDIDVEAPIKLGTLRWPGGIAGSLVPKPDSELGKTEWEHDESFFLKVGNMNREKFNAYIEQCSESGFCIDYERDDDWYRAENEEGYSLSIEYEGFEIISISLERPENEMFPTDPPETEIETAPQTEEQISDFETGWDEPSESVSIPEDDKDDNTIRPEIKEAIDSYEAFVDEYCEFMERYDSSDTSLLSEYLELINKESEMLKKFEEIDQNGMTNAEALYYNEVSLRCSQKLLAASAH